MLICAKQLITDPGNENPGYEPVPGMLPLCMVWSCYKDTSWLTLFSHFVFTSCSNASIFNLMDLNHWMINKIMNLKTIFKIHEQWLWEGQGWNEHRFYRSSRPLVLHVHPSSLSPYANNPWRQPNCEKGVIRSSVQF